MMLADDEVHVWRIATEMPRDLAALRQTLSADEQARADRFRFDRDRRRAIVRRAALRAIVGSYVGAAPIELRFLYGPQGKPGLAPPFSESGYQFNLSFSGELALCAVGRAPLGVDLEAQRLVENGALVARHFFTPDEISLQLSAVDPNEVFLRHWTRKEALIKATGSGLSVPLQSFDVSWQNGGDSRQVTLPDAEGRPTIWWLSDICPLPGWPAALATVSRVRLLQWQDWRE
jgi:4'-phosphopantetheinyl transferase